MWKPKKIVIKNLFAHKNSQYEFRNGTCTVIFGKNDTDKGMENNGAGKTTLFEAVSIALTGESLRNFKKEVFINRDADDALVDFELHNEVLKTSLRIVRKFFRGNKTSRIEIYENGEVNNQITSVAEANKRIVELIGISREDLLRYYIISQDNHYTFFTAGDVDKKEVMNRITSADMINPLIEKLKVQESKLNGDIRDLEIKRQRLISRIETIDEQREEWLRKPSNEDKVKELLEDIKELEKELEESSRSIDRVGSDVIQKKAELSKITIPKVEKSKKQKADAEAKIDEIDEEAREIKSLKTDIETFIDGKLECPHCHKEFAVENELELTLEEAVETLPELEETLKDCEIRRKAQESKKKRAVEEIKKHAEIKRAADELNDAIEALNRKSKKLKRDREDVEDRIGSINSRIEELRKEAEEDRTLVNMLKKKKEAEDELKPLEEEKSRIEKDLEMIRFWIFNLGKNGFMTYLANKSIKVIEGTTNNFLSKFGVDLRVEMSGFTVLKSGEVREKIDISVSNDGCTWEPFLGKSGGERGRVALAGVLAIQHLINSSLGGRGLDMLLFDECFHGLDSRGQENIIKIFERLGITTMVITQNVSEGFNNENTLYVVKTDGVSEYTPRQSYYVDKNS